MADTLITEYKLQLDKAIADLRVLEAEFGKAGKAAEESGKAGKTAAEGIEKAFNKTSEKILQSGNSINELRTRLEQLTAARDRSFNPASVERLNAKILETNSKINQLTASARRTGQTISGSMKQAADSTAKATEKILQTAKSVSELRTRLAQITAARDKSFNPIAIERFNAKIAETNAKINQLTASAKPAGQGISTAMKTAGDSANNLSGILSKVGGMIAGAFAVEKLIGFGKEMIMLSANAEGITRAFQRLNKPGLLDEMRAATKGTVSDVELMKNAVKASNFQLPLDQLATLFKFAGQRARDTGESVDYLVDSIVLGIGRKSPLILDNLGISAVRLREKFKGLSAEEQDVAAVAKAVGEIVNEELEKQGKVADTTADKFARFTATSLNNMKEFGDALSPLTNNILDYGGALLQFTLRSVQALIAPITTLNQIDEKINTQKRKEAFDSTIAFLDLALKRDKETGASSEKRATSIKAEIKSLKDRLKLAEGDDKIRITGQLKAYEQVLESVQNLEKETPAITIRNVAFLEAEIKIQQEKQKAVNASIKTVKEARSAEIKLQAELAELLGKESEEGKKRAAAEKKALDDSKAAQEKYAQDLLNLTNELNQTRAKSVEDSEQRQIEILQAAADKRISELEKERIDTIANVNLDGDQKITKLKLIADIQRELEISTNRAIDDVREETHQKDLARLEEYQKKIKEADDFIEAAFTQAAKREGDKRKELKEQAIQAAKDTGKEVAEGLGQILKDSTNQQLEDKKKAENDALNEKYATEAEKLQAQFDNELISKQTFDTKKKALDKKKQAEESELKKQQWQADKDAALSNILIDTAVSIIKTFAQYGFTVAGAIAAGGAATAGGVQYGVVSAKKPPKFAKGTRYVEGAGTGTSDDIDAKLSRGERVVTAIDNKDYWEPLEAIRTHAISPKHLTQLIKKAQTQGNFAQNMTNSMQFDDSYLRHDIQNNKEVRLEKKSIEMLADSIASKTKSTPKKQWASYE